MTTPHVRAVDSAWSIAADDAKEPMWPWVPVVPAGEPRLWPRRIESGMEVSLSPFRKHRQKLGARETIGSSAIL